MVGKAGLFSLLHYEGDYEAVSSGVLVALVKRFIDLILS